jgi:hypothetical protein
LHGVDAYSLFVPPADQEALKRLRTENEDQKHGIEIVRKAIQTPAREPQYEIKSDKTDHIARHKGSALNRVR